MEAKSPGFNRQAGTSPVAERLAFWPDLEAFLTQYDGLTLRFVRRRSRRWDAIKLDACWVAAVADGEWMTRHSELTGAWLAPIGAAYSEHLLIWLTEDGRFFATYDALLAEIGRTPGQLLDTLLNERVELGDTDVV